MPTTSPRVATANRAALAGIAPSANRIERRSSTRPRFIESWQKILSSDWDRADCADASSSPARVCVWIARTESLLKAQSCLTLLTADDWAVLRRLQARTTRDGAMAAKLLLRLGLSQIVERRIAPREWHFRNTSLGKPMIGNPTRPINFSISHADAVVVVAVSSDLNLGIDVESVDQAFTENVISGFSHVNEQRVLQRLPDHLKAREFVRLWTQKEAFTKLLGCGHTMDFSSIECSSVADLARADAYSAPAVHFESFYVPVDHSLYHASLAVEKSHSICGPIEIRLINVAGPSSGNTCPIAAVN